MLVMAIAAGTAMAILPDLAPWPASRGHRLPAVRRFVVNREGELSWHGRNVWAELAIFGLSVWIGAAPRWVRVVKEAVKVVRRSALQLNLALGQAGRMEAVSRGQLRIYLGAAPGVGEDLRHARRGHRRKGRALTWWSAWSRRTGAMHTQDLIGDLEAVPRKTLVHRGSTFTEMDTDAVIAASPTDRAGDELAHSNVPARATRSGGRTSTSCSTRASRFCPALNIQHLEVAQRRGADDHGRAAARDRTREIVRRAEQVELVDMTPEALRRRMVHGQPARAGLAWLADKVDEQLDKYRCRAQHRQHMGVAGAGRGWRWTGGPAEGRTLIRRATRIADRTRGADLMAVHVAQSDGLAGADPALLAKQRSWWKSRRHLSRGGGTASQIPLGLCPQRQRHQLVLGASRRGRFAQISPAV
jgi:two-component system sensor histidine kinase KdpD